MKVKIVTSIAIAGLLSACTTPGPVSIGQDTYLLTDRASQSYTSAGTLKANLYRQGTAFCARKKLEFQPIREQTTDGRPNSWTWASAEIQFRCLASNDPELSRPNLKKDADVVIENINPKNNSETKVATDLYTELSKLKDLLDSKVITQEEFDTQKKSVLQKYK